MAREVTLAEARAATGRPIKLPTFLPSGISSEPTITLSEPPDGPAGMVTTRFSPSLDSLELGKVREVTVIDGPGELSLSKFAPRIAKCGAFDVQVHAFDPFDGRATVMSCWIDGEYTHGVSVSWIEPGPSKSEMCDTVMRIASSIIGG